MNKKQRRLQKFTRLRAPLIHCQGRALTLLEAGAMANQALQHKHFAAAVEIYDQMLSHVLGQAEIFNNRGVALMELGRYDEALESFGRSLAIKPDHAETHNNRGAVLQKLGRYHEALASYDNAIALRAAYVNAHHNRASLLKQLKRPEEALAGFDAAIALNAIHVEAHNNRGVLLQEMKRYDEALASFDRAIALNPNHVEAQNNRGIVLVNKGDIGAAEKMFLQALRLKPNSSAPWFSLVNIRQYQSGDNADAQAIQILLREPALPLADRECLQFSLGKIYDDSGLYDEAFACYQQANQNRNATVSYNAEQVSHQTSRLVEVFSREFLARPSSPGPSGRFPLLVVGMPRSGTTLLANILSQHHRIATVGELATIPDLIAEFLDPAANGISYPESVRELDPDLALRLTAHYERRLGRDAGSGQLGIIDKNPLNFRHLGLIARLFPQARVIHCTRDPLDTGLSNYFQRFPSSLSYAFDLANIGHFQGEYARLMAHWHTALPLKMAAVSYEDMVLRTETTVGQLLNFLELEWDERCLSPHTNPCPVESASQWQVRQPIYRQSVGRWRHYEKYLDSLKAGLGRAGLGGFPAG
jgi:tetratricopeptide (TPR) repeat protein